MPYHEKVDLSDLINRGLIHSGEKIFGYHYRERYEAIITSDCKIKTLHDNETFESLSHAASHITGTNVNGWHWRRCNDKTGKEYRINTLRDKYNQLYDC